MTRKGLSLLFRAASRILSVPAALTLNVSAGCFMEYSTCVIAARWNTISLPSAAFSTEFESVMSPYFIFISSLMLSRLPRPSGSPFFPRPSTSQPPLTRSLTSHEPINPVPPVTRTRCMLFPPYFPWREPLTPHIVHVFVILVRVHCVEEPLVRKHNKLVRVCQN